MAHNKLYRNFIILQEDEKSHASSGDKALSGYAKIEAKGDKCKISFYAQNLKKENKYSMVLICYKKDMKQVVDLGSLEVSEVGKGESSKEYYVNNIAGLDFSYDKVSGAAICERRSGELNFLMYGFMNGENISDNWKSCKVVRHDERHEEIVKEKLEIRNVKEEHIIQKDQEEEIRHKKDKKCKEYKEEKKDCKEDKKDYKEHKEDCKDYKEYKEHKEDCKDYKEYKEHKEDCKDYKEHKEYKEDCKDYKEHKEYKEDCKDYKEHKEHKEDYKDYQEHKEYKEDCKDYKEHKEHKEDYKDYQEHKEHKEDCKDYKEHKEYKEDCKEHKEDCKEKKEEYKEYKSCDKYEKDEGYKKEYKEKKEIYSIEDVCGNHKKNNDDHEYKYKCCEKRPDSTSFEEYELRIEENKTIDPFAFELRGSIGKFFENIVEGFDEIKSEFKEIKYCKWYKVKVSNIDDMCNISNYNKYTIAYYPMINYYPYIRKYGHFMLGYKCDDKGDLKYIVYAVPGRKDLEEQPYAGKTGFVTWMSGENYRDGYWLMFYDYRNSTIVVPMK